jgi:hypothetical protein
MLMPLSCETVCGCGCEGVVRALPLVVTATMEQRRISAGRGHSSQSSSRRSSRRDYCELTWRACFRGWMFGKVMEYCRDTMP